MDNKINILQVVIGGKNYNGITSFLYQQYKFFNRDKVHCDYLSAKKNPFEMFQDDSIFSESIFYYLDIKKQNSKTKYCTLARELKKILTNTHYDAVVVNSSVIELSLACFFGAKGTGTKIIAHAHNAGLFIAKGTLRYKYSFITNKVEDVFRRFVRTRFDWLFGCSEAAIEVTFGKKALKQQNYLVVKNAVDVDIFSPNEEYRNSIRIEMGVSNDDVVFGYVGSIIPIKNLELLIKIFGYLHSEVPNTKLWLVGNGDQTNNLQQLAQKIGVENDIVFFGQRKDVSKIMQGMDSFILTSLTEGLGIVAIEAQAAGLPTTVSSGVPDDVLISPLAQKISLNATPQEWAERILLQLKAHPQREHVSAFIIKAGYDIKSESERIQKFYVEKLAH